MNQHAPAHPVPALDHAEDLTALASPDCAALLYRRTLDPAVQRWLTGLRPDQLPRTRITVRPDAVRRAAMEACTAARTPDTPERAALLDDIQSLATPFARLMQAQWLRLRLDIVETNACRKFHVDTLTARLVCTYRGTGTHYGFAAPGGTPETVQTVPTGTPLLMRGTRWPTQTPTGFLHRSPPIEGTGETRVVLVLDPAAAPGDAH